MSFRQTLKSCLEGAAHGDIPAHGVFLYPKTHGYGEVWQRMGDALGDRLMLSTPVRKIDLSTRTVNDELQADFIVSSIPWTAWTGFSDLPAVVRSDIDRLEYASIDVDYVAQQPATKAHWVYEPDESVSYHRMLCRTNFLEGSRGHWTETNSKRALDPGAWRHRNEFAYPLNTNGKPEAVERILAWAAGIGVEGLGRWGRWEHMNSDVAVADAISAAGRAVERSPPG